MRCEGYGFNDPVESGGAIAFSRVKQNESQKSVAILSGCFLFFSLDVGSPVPVLLWNSKSVSGELLAGCILHAVSLLLFIVKRRFIPEP